VSFDPHALKLYVDGNCWENPGGNGGFAIRVEFPFDWNRGDELVEWRGYFETNNQRMELRACVCAHEWVYENLDTLGVQRVQVITDSQYVCNGYSWAIGWSQNDYCNRDGRPIKNEELWKNLMRLRRKLAHGVWIEVKWIPRRSSQIAKGVDQDAKAAGRLPAHVDRGFSSGKVGRPKNNARGSAKLYPAAGQTPYIRPYKSGMARRDIQLFKFEVWDEAKEMFFDKFEAYASSQIGNELHRQNVYQVRMNDTPNYPRIIEIIARFKEPEFLAQVSAPESEGVETV
jgi:ribonuclease HI